MSPIRVSFIDFLNSVPLGWGFLNGSLRGKFDVSFDVPSACAQRLAEGRVDVGLIPVIEYQRIQDLRVIPGISVSSRRDVKSVLCVSRVPLESARRIVLDTASRTSAALLQVLLRRRFHNRETEFVESEARPDRMLESADAALVIGNPALQIECAGLHIYDLAREWHRFSGLPFVFAFWATRIDTPELTGWLQQSLREGLSALPAIAADYGPRLGLGVEETLGYLTRNLNYELGSDHLEALNLFFDLCAEEGLIEEKRPLQWLAATPAASR